MQSASQQKNQMDETVEENRAKLTAEPDWFNGKINYSSPNSRLSYMYNKDGLIHEGTNNKDGPIQEDDAFKPFLFDMGQYGLNYAYKKLNNAPNSVDFKYTKTEKPRNVLIIGAGMSGLVSGYELAQVGHNVHILEMQHRVGGRVKTVGDDKFYPGLWSDAGAMRLPGTGKPGWTGPSHFMTDFYAQKFELPLKTFVNISDQGFYHFYGHERIKMKKWNQNSGFYCDKFWSEWRKTIKKKENSECLTNISLKDIGEYWKASVKPVTDELRTRLAMDPSKAWENWVKKWATFSVKDYLSFSYKEILTQLKNNGVFEDVDKETLKVLEYLHPWPLDAILGYGAISYTISLEVSLVDWLRDDLGEWWKDPMHTFEEGMQMLPRAFSKPNTKGWNTDVDLSKNITFGVKARKIHYKPGYVEVICHNSSTKKDQVFIGDIVIVTLPLNIVRQMTFSPPLPVTIYKAIENVSYTPSTKIMLQCKTQFWQEDELDGGFSKTDMPIGQLHYPSNPDFKIPKTDRGILMCYTWKREALLFGSQKREDAITEAVEEISMIHPQIHKHFETGEVQAWYSDPTSQGAFCSPKPKEYLAQAILYNPHENIFFCGEAISTTNGWIQGALVSGLRAAFQLYKRNENNEI